MRRVNTPGPRRPRYVHGSSNKVELITPVTNGAATLTLGTHTQSLTLGTDNRPTFGSPLLDGFSMKLKAKTGEFSGSLLLDGARVKFGGVLLERTGDGVGALPDAAVTLEPL